MKRSYKKLLSVIGAIAIVAPFTGCEADAEETNDATTNSSGASASVPAAETNSASSGTNAATAEIGGTNVVTQQTTIIQRIPPTIPADVTLSTGVQEVVRLLQSGVSETVVLLFVEKSTDSFELDAADIVYLNDIGVPPTVLAAMLNHDGVDPDILHDALNTNTVQVATAPPATVVQSNYVTQLPPVEVSSNYVAAPQYGGTPVVQDPNAQQQVVVEQQPVIVETQPAVTYSYFYNSLSPYGSWVYLTDYGWCWQPTIAVTHHSWRPYVHGGRWLHSDAGWYWHSDYSWGWAPFHYGRWHSSPRVGWVWTPDYTWGPSWVTWRRGADYCGWAPLPPRSYVRPGVGFSYWGSDVGFSFGFGYSHDYYTFVPTRRFCDRRVIDHVVPTDRTRNIYRDSTVVNNYVVGNNNTIINNGVGRDYVQRHTREIPHVRVQEQTGGGRVRPDRLVRDGAETVVYRPQRPAPTQVAAHEAAVARTRSETARAAGNSIAADGRGAVRPNTIASRPATSDAVRPRADAVGRATTPTTPRGGNVTAERTETARPQLARGNTEVAAPVFGTPAPVRPEPDRSAEIIRSRTTQEGRIRSSTTIGAGSTGAGSVSSVTTTVRPTTPARNIVPRYTQTLPESGSATQGTGVSPGSTRPGTPAVSTPPARSEVGRGNSTTPRPVPPATPAQRPTEAVRPRAELARPANSVPSVQSPAPNNTRAPSPTFSRPNATATTPSTAAPAPQARPSQPVAQSPAFSRPVTSPSVQNVPPRSAAPAQPVQRQAPAVQTPQPAARLQVIQRSENFSRSAMPTQPVPSRSVVQPQRPMTSVPSAPAQQPFMGSPRPSAPAPTVSAAPVRNAPSVNVSPAPASRGSVRSAPPAPASRPSAAPPSRVESRGRVEIGR